MKHYSILTVIALLLSIITIACNSSSTKKFPDDLNVLILSVDTLPARFISGYGSTTQTPHIDKLAKNGVRFARTYASAPWTKPAFTTIFSGTYPKTHTVKRLDSKIPSELPLLPEIMKASGRQTAAIVSHTVLSPKAGFARGFDYFKNVNPRNPHKAIVGQSVTQEAINWLNNRDKNSNFFLFLHYFDPHYNYNNHSKFDETSSYTGKLKPATDIRELRKQIPTFKDEDTQYLRGLFAEEIRYTDEQVGVLMEHLEKNDLLKNTLIIFISDHGVEIMERNWIGHTRNLYNDLIEVPFIISLPKIIPNKTVTIPVSQTDLAPTILEITDTKSNSNFEGISLVPYLLKENIILNERPIFSDVDFKSGSHLKDAFKTAVIKGDYKLIHNREDNSFELYNIIKDPTEQKNIALENQSIVNSLKELLSGYESSKREIQKNNQLDITPDEVKQLQSLGYM